MLCADKLLSQDFVKSILHTHKAHIQKAKTTTDPNKKCPTDYRLTAVVVQVIIVHLLYLRPVCTKKETPPSQVDFLQKQICASKLTAAKFNSFCYLLGQRFLLSFLLFSLRQNLVLVCVLSLSFFVSHKWHMKAMVAQRCHLVHGTLLLHKMIWGLSDLMKYKPQHYLTFVQMNMENRNVYFFYSMLISDPVILAVPLQYDDSLQWPKL